MDVMVVKAIPMYEIEEVERWWRMVQTSQRVMGLQGVPDFPSGR
jgi:hypothetical protein